MNRNFLIIHYNTPFLTECLVRSVNRFVSDAIIYIFDNSTTKPFTASFNNVTVLDNTQGQIIDFDEVLKKYPDKEKTSAKKNNYASAKHCLSVDKCMEIIGENFVLLDSDVLVKRDLSILFKKDCAFIGSTELWRARVLSQGNLHPPAKYRAVPYACFINVEMCKKHGIRYFNEKYMYGLSAQGDSYDTGTYFLEQIATKKLKWIKIDFHDYVVHYKAASWVDEAKKHDGYKQISDDKWLDNNREYWDGERSHNKNVIYTCITGDYDNLLEPVSVSEGFDYVCFSDDPTLKSNVWEIRGLPAETDSLSNVKKQRYVKLHPHVLFSEYRMSVWVDGNVIIKGRLNEFIKENVKDPLCSIIVPQHPQRNCLYAEAEVIIKWHKDKSEIVKPQMERYENEGFPKNYGLLQSNIMIRLHNDLDCIKFMEEWFEEIKKGSHRDQLSFNYISWKNKDIRIEYMPKKIYDSKWFKWKALHDSKVKNKNSIKKDEESKKRKRRIIKERRPLTFNNPYASYDSGMMYEGFVAY